MRSIKVFKTAILIWLCLNITSLAHPSVYARAVEADLYGTSEPLSATPSPALPVKTTPSTSTLYNDSITIRDVPPPYDQSEYFEFINFPTPNHISAVTHALLGAQLMISHTLSILGRGLPTPNPPVTNLSFNRYFNPNDLPAVSSVLQGLLAVLGAPHTGAIRNCLVVPKLQVWFLTHPDNPTRCDNIDQCRT